MKRKLKVHKKGVAWQMSNIGSVDSSKFYFINKIKKYLDKISIAAKLIKIYAKLIYLIQDIPLQGSKHREKYFFLIKVNN